MTREERSPTGAYLLPSRAVAFINLIPVFGVILATAFLGENIHGFHVAGAVCIIAGIRLVVSNTPTGLRR